MGGGPRLGFVLEQTLGHVSHAKNLRRALTDSDEASISWVDLPFEPTSSRDRLPGLSNWTVRSSLAARKGVRALEQQAPLDGLFVHTHVPATFLGAAMERIPTVVSIDATPHQIDSLGGSYQHQVHPGFVESIKWRLHARSFQRAAAMVTWSQWAADSLVSDYGVSRGRIEVIPPGVTPSLWQRQTPSQPTDGPVRILFVGGDFERKGGDLLLKAFAELRLDPEIAANGLELHLVTGADVPAAPGVHVHSGLTPNSPEIIDLFHRCDVFVLPTRGDTNALVLSEAATAGLPVVTTDVGAISESVLDGVTGHLVEANDASVAHGLRRLVVDPEYRLRLGAAAANHAAETMNADRNARRLLHLMTEVSRHDGIASAPLDRTAS